MSVRLPAAEQQHLLLPHDVGEVQLPAGDTAPVQLQAVEETLEALLEVLDLTESAGHEVQHRPGLGTGEQLLGEAPADQVGRDEAGGALTEEETVSASSSSSSSSSPLSSSSSSSSPSSSSSSSSSSP